MATQKDPINICVIGPFDNGKSTIIASLNSDNKTFSWNHPYSPTKASTATELIWDDQPIIFNELPNINPMRKADASTYQHLQKAELVCIVLNFSPVDNSNNVTEENIKAWVKFAKLYAPQGVPIRLLINQTSSSTTGTTPKDLDIVFQRKISGYFQSAYGYSSGKEDIHCNITDIESTKKFIQSDFQTINHKKNLKEIKNKPSESTSENQSSGINFIAYFGNSNFVRNSFFVGIAAFFGIIVLSALGGPIPFMATLGAFVVLGAIGTLVGGITALADDIKVFYRGFFDYKKTPMELKLRAVFTGLLGKFADWIREHKVGFTVGVLLFLATLATLITLAFFPPGTLAVIPFLFNTINILSTGFINLGIGMSSFSAILAGATSLGITTMAVWDMGCRVCNAVADVIIKQKATSQNSLKTQDTTEDAPRSHNTGSNTASIFSSLSSTVGSFFSSLTMTEEEQSIAEKQRLINAAFNVSKGGQTTQKNLTP